MGVTKSFTYKELDPNKVAIPCGLKAYTYFNGILYIRLKKYDLYHNIFFFF